jgi:uncharacterized OB-fold protein
MNTIAPAKPLPKMDPVTRGFWDLRQGKLSVQRCDDCGHQHYPGGPVCPACLSSHLSWAPVLGRGKVLSWVRFHRAHWDAFRGDLPYIVCLIGLEEGPMMISNLVGPPNQEPRIGAPVEAVFEQVTDEVTLPKFRLLQD